MGIWPGWRSLVPDCTSLLTRWVGEDQESFTCSCQDALWVKLREEEELFVSDQVVGFCQRLRDSIAPSSLPIPCLARFSKHGNNLKVNI